MSWVVIYCLVALSLAAVFALARVERGPGVLDRVVALDIITAVVLGGVAVLTATDDRTDLLPVLIVLSIVGFVSSVTVARFAAAESKEEARILTREELEALLAVERELTDEDAPVHDPDAVEEAVPLDDAGQLTGDGQEEER